MSSRTMIAHVVLFVLAAFVLAAHFLRQGNLALTAVSLAVPLLLLVRRRWSLIVLQGCAYAAALVWSLTAAELVAERMAAGIPWIRTALILGTVAILTLAAGALLNTRAARSRYPRREAGSSPPNTPHGP